MCNDYSSFGGMSLSLLFIAALMLASADSYKFAIVAQGDSRAAKQDTTKQELSSLQHQIENARTRLSSSDTETRRDAVLRLGALKRPEGSRVAAAALNDSSPIVRATAVHALGALDGNEAATLLLPLLQKDKDEFVRREVAYALGQTKSRHSTNALIVALAQDKSAAVRAAAAIALGEIGDATAVPALALIIVRRASDAQLDAASNAQGSTKFRREKDEFVRRSAARALGQLKDSRATPALVIALGDKNSSDDLKREAALSLGNIGDARAVPALEAATAARDPYLSRIASEALKKITVTGKIASSANISLHPFRRA